MNDRILGPWRTATLVALVVGLLLYVIVSPPTQDTWRTLTLGGVATGQIAFCLLYATFPWYKSFLGRALFFKALVLALITGTYLLTRLLGWTNINETFIILYGLLAVGVWVQFFAFLKVRREGKAERAVNSDTNLKVEHDRRSTD